MAGPNGLGGTTSSNLHSWMSALWQSKRSRADPGLVDVLNASTHLIARDMVTAPHRVGDQAQFIHRPLATSPSGISGTLQWAQQHLHRPLTVADLARHARTTPRT